MAFVRLRRHYFFPKTCINSSIYQRQKNGWEFRMKIGGAPKAAVGRRDDVVNSLKKQRLR
jgi:hypothetical protein